MQKLVRKAATWYIYPFSHMTIAHYQKTSHFCHQWVKLALMGQFIASTTDLQAKFGGHGRTKRKCDAEKNLKLLCKFLILFLVSEYHD